MFKIEKQIPLPTETQDAEKYPFNDMEIGDSFVASTDVMQFINIVEDMEKRNEAGDGRMFISWASMRDPMCSTLRIWRVFPRDYLEKNQNEKAILDWIIALIGDNGPQTRSKITQKDLGAEGSGSRKHRLRVLDKYAFLFKQSDAKCGGVLYENV